MDETRKHQNHYFPPTTKHHAKKIKNDEQNGGETSVGATYNAANPVNFLFSNENDFDDDNDDDYT